MTAGPDVIVLGDDLPYADGSESTILSILRSCTDVSSRSDELAAHIVDWPTRYHLSRLRSMLFAPLTVTPGMRILEIGCGTGVNLRVMAERGADVVGVEGSLLRARCARERCRDLDNVTIYAGDVGDLPDIGEFDLVLLIGVLEYSPAGSGGSRGPIDLLTRATSFIAPAGSLVLAIENQLGMKYLLGYREDHHGRPWVGLDDYRTVNGARTWSRHELATMLSAAGLRQQSWCFPFPDYKLPTFIASGDLFASEAGREIAAAFIDQPIVDHSAQPAVTADPPSFFSAALRAGIAPDIANSFLVVAGRDGASKVVDNGLAWLSTQERATQFMVNRVIRSVDTVSQVAGPTPAAPATDGWLENIGHGNQQIILDGPTLATSLLTALDDEPKMASSIWQRYLTFLTGEFGLDSGQLDGAAVDCTLSNIINGDELTFIDREWRLAASIPMQIVLSRALYGMALRVVRRPGEQRTVGEIMHALAVSVDHELSEADIEAFCEFEGRFQAHVHGRHDELSGSIRASLDVSATNLADLVVMTDLIAHARSLEQHAAGLEQHAAGLEQHAAGLEQHAAGLEQALNAERAEMRRVHDVIARFESERDAAVQRATQTEADLNMLLRSRSFRLGRLLLRPLSVLRRR